MKAAFLDAVGDPFTIRETPDPVPGPGQVRIRTRASGVCGTDVHYWNGALPIKLPVILGHEPVGVVESLGPGCRWLRVGDRVGVSWVQAGCGRCRSCQQHRINFCPDQRTWVTNGGGHAEYLIAEEAGCTLLPEDLPWEAAAPMFCAGYTVMSGYRNARPRPGDKVAIIGLGGLGHIAVQVAKALGHTVVAVTGSEAKRAEAKELGADETLVVREHAGKELAGMGGVDIVLSTSNSMEQNSQVLEGLLPEGRLVTMAIAPEPIRIDPLLALDRQLSVVGSQQSGRADQVEILELAAAERVKPWVEPYRLEEIDRAMNRLAENKVRYRAVLLHNA